jgi:hypothetical protein
VLGDPSHLVAAETLCGVNVDEFVRRVAAMERVVEAGKERIVWNGRTCPEWPAMVGCPAHCGNHRLCAALAALDEMEGTRDYRRSPQYAEGKKAQKALLSLGRDKDTLLVENEMEVNDD